MMMKSLAATLLALCSVAQAQSLSSEGHCVSEPYSIVKFGAQPNGPDAMPAFEAAYWAMLLDWGSDGASICVPAGTWHASSQGYFLVAARNWSIRGAGGASKIVVDAPYLSFVFNVGAAELFHASDLQVVGSASAPSAIFSIGSTLQAVIERVNFNALKATAGVIYAQTSGLTVRDSRFYGVTIGDCILYDKGNYTGLRVENVSYNDLPGYTPRAFVAVGQPASGLHPDRLTRGGNENPSIVIRGAFVDELANKILIDSGDPAKRWARVLLEDLTMNARGVVTDELLIKYVDHLEVRRSLLGWMGHDQATFLRLVGVRSATVDGVYRHHHPQGTQDGNNTIVTDAATLALDVRDSNLRIEADAATTVRTWMVGP